MAIKFPLKMKDDIDVRDLESLRKSFDLEKIVGYFMDGKLSKWLEVRYYEDELKKVQQLEKSDILLAEKLCDIFGVEYKKENVDAEAIELKNKRLQMVKQITEDEEVIKNIENVAFKQEELVDIYDRGVETIYLLKGEFSIPESKNNITYKEYGNPIIKWEKTKKEINIQKSSSVRLPLKIVEYINLNKYIETNDYIVFKEYGKYKKFNKKTEKITDILIPPKYKASLTGDGFYFCSENKVLFEGHINLYPGYILVYDLDTDKYKEIYSFKGCGEGYYGEKYVSNDKLAYSSNESIWIVDLDKGVSIRCFDEWVYSPANWILFKDKIIYSNGKQVSVYEENKYGNKVDILDLNYDNIKFYPYKENLFIIQYGRKNSFNIFMLTETELGYDCRKVYDGSKINIEFEEKFDSYNSTQYIPFLDKNLSTICVFDMNTFEVRKAAKTCEYRGKFCKSPLYQMIGDYLLYRKNEDIHCFDLETGKSWIIDLVE